MLVQWHITAVRTVALAAFALAASAPDAQPADLFVSPSGNDGGAGSSNSPLREIRRALALVQAGDTVHVADGFYLGFTASGLHGTAASPIALKAAGNAAWVQRTTDRSDNRDNIFITFCSHLVLDGLNSSNAPRAAVRVDQSPHVTVRNGRFGGNATWGIFTDFSDDLRIENNECFSSRSQHGIYTSNSGDRPILRRNRCHDNAGAGIHMNGDASAGGDGLISGALVEGNVLWNNGALGGSGLNMDGVQDSVVRNNLLYGNHATGIAMFRIDGAGGPKGNLLAHNTVDQAADGRWALLLGQADGTNVVRNNILHQRNPSSLRGCVLYGSAADAALTAGGWNAWGGNAYVSTDDAANRLSLAAWQALGHEPNSVAAGVADLVVAAPGDYRLKPSSAAIDAGLTLAGVSADLEWLTRPAGAASDMGAYEYGAAPAAPRIVSLALSGAGVQLTFTTLPGKVYRVGHGDGMSSALTNGVSGAIAGLGDPESYTDAAASERPARFYRVWLAP